MGKEDNRLIMKRFDAWFSNDGSDGNVSWESGKAKCRGGRKNDNGSRSVSPPSPPSFANKRQPLAGQPRRIVADFHANDIYGLQPAASWELYIDESGRFAESPDGEMDERRLVAGVLFPTDRPLPPQAPLHACENTTKEQFQAEDEVINAVLRAGRESRACGVLVVPARVYPGGAENWMPNIASFITLVMRMLPLPDKGEVRLNVHAENYLGYYCHWKDFKKIEDWCKLELKRSLPERARRIKLSVGMQGKESSPFNAYPDVIAHACFVCKGHSEELRATGWSGTCFLNFTADQIGQLLQCYESRETLPADLWSTTLAARHGTTGLVAAILRAYGEEARQNRHVWRKYLDYFVAHLDSRAIKIGLLGRQLDWLAEYAPADAALPPGVRLLWRTARLAESNHRGGVVPKDLTDFRKLMAEVSESDMPLACSAALHLAVSFTDAFDFRGAKKVIGDFVQPLTVSIAEIAGIEKSAIAARMRAVQPCADRLFRMSLGAKGYGRLLSSLGQHAAFLGDPAKAARYFWRAVEMFKFMSERAVRSEDMAQTGAYLVTAMMDDPRSDGAELQQLMTAYLGGYASLEELAEEMAMNNVAGDKYRHHILLRYLLSGRAPESAKKAYLSQEKNWASSEDGHPWELIEFYRGALLLGTDRAVKHFRPAWAIARAGGPTLQVIAAVIGCALAAEGGVLVEEVEALVERCAQEVPALGEDRIAVLRRQSREPLAALELAKAILPFNFR